MSRLLSIPAGAGRTVISLIAKKGEKIIQGIVPTKFFVDDLEPFIREYNRTSEGKLTVQRMIYVALRTYIENEKNKEGKA